ncbi:MAG: quinone oxidoreductase family protein [Vulcanimicrobiaceae bacterium]
MNAIRIAATGGPEVLQLRDLPIPEPKAGEVLVRIEAAGVNFIDVYERTGLYPPARLPFVPGREGAGLVERVGEGVTDFTAGARVAFAMVEGAYAEFASIPAARLVPVPPGVTLTDAAALMLQGMTAHYLSHDTFALAAGMTALVHAGAGGVGSLLTQFAKAKGATVIATVGSDEKAERSRRAGADHVIVYTREDFGERTRALCGGAKVDVVYDSVGASTWQRSLEVLRPRGYFVLFGASSGPVPPFDLQILNAKGSLFATRPSLGHYVLTRAELLARAQAVFAARADGTLALLPVRTYPLADAAHAHQDLEARRTVGKLLLLPGGSPADQI